MTADPRLVAIEGYTDHETRNEKHFHQVSVDRVYSWSVGYAKTGKSTCQATKERIKAGHLRIGKEIDNPYVAGTRTFIWFKPGPLFELFRKSTTEAPRIKSTAELLNFETLKKSDAAYLEELVLSTAAIFAEADAAKEKAEAEQIVEIAQSLGSFAAQDDDEEKYGTPVTWSVEEEAIFFAGPSGNFLKPAIKPYSRVRLSNGPGGIRRVKLDQGANECEHITHGFEGSDGKSAAARSLSGAQGLRDHALVLKPRDRDAILSSVAEDWTRVRFTEEHWADEEVLLMVSALWVT